MIEEEPAPKEPGEGDSQSLLQRLAAIGVMLILAVGVLGALYLVVDETSGEPEPTPGPPQLGGDLTPPSTLTPQPTQTVARGTIIPTETPRPAITPTQDSLRPTPREQPPEVSSEPIVLPSGLSYVILEEGDGPLPKVGEMVGVEYNGWLQDGTLFDSTYLSGNRVFSYTVGSGVIAGFDEGVQLTPIGGTSLLYIPPGLAYGAEGRSGIPPNATLIFEITVVVPAPIIP